MNNQKSLNLPCSTTQISGLGLLLTSHFCLLLHPAILSVCRYCVHLMCENTMFTQHTNDILVRNLCCYFGGVSSRPAAIRLSELGPKHYNTGINILAKHQCHPSPLVFFFSFFQYTANRTKSN